MRVRRTHRRSVFDEVEGDRIGLIPPYGTKDQPLGNIEYKPTTDLEAPVNLHLAPQRVLLKHDSSPLIYLPLWNVGNEGVDRLESITASVTELYRGLVE